MNDTLFFEDIAHEIEAIRARVQVRRERLDAEPFDAALLLEHRLTVAATAARWVVKPKGKKARATA